MGHIKGSINLSLSDIDAKLKELDKNKSYVIYCRSGARSNTAANILTNNGF